MKLNKKDKEIRKSLQNVKEATIKEFESRLQTMFGVDTTDNSIRNLRNFIESAVESTFWEALKLNK